MAYELVTQQVIPTSGNTVTINNSSGGFLYLNVDTAGTLAALTIKLPNVTFDGQAVFITFTKAITSLTYQAGVAGATFSSVAASASANITQGFVYNQAVNKWYKLV